MTTTTETKSKQKNSFFSGFLVHRLWANFIEDNSTKQKLFLLLLTVFFFFSPRSPQSNAVLYFAKMLLFFCSLSYCLCDLTSSLYIRFWDRLKLSRALSNFQLHFLVGSAMRDESAYVARGSWVKIIGEEENFHKKKSYEMTLHSQCSISTHFQHGSLSLCAA